MWVLTSTFCSIGPRTVPGKMRWFELPGDANPRSKLVPQKCKWLQPCLSHSVTHVSWPYKFPGGERHLVGATLQVPRGGATRSGGATFKWLNTVHVFAGRCDLLQPIARDFYSSVSPLAIWIWLYHTTKTRTDANSIVIRSCRSSTFLNRSCLSQSGTNLLRKAVYQNYYCNASFSLEHVITSCSKYVIQKRTAVYCNTTSRLLDDDLLKKRPRDAVRPRAAINMRLRDAGYEAA